MTKLNRKPIASVIVAVVVLASTLFYAPLTAQGTSKLPWSAAAHTCTQGNDGATSHRGVNQYVFDFPMSDHTPILAVH